MSSTRAPSPLVLALGLCLALAMPVARAAPAAASAPGPASVNPATPQVAVGNGADEASLRQWLAPQLDALAAHEGWSRYTLTLSLPQASALPGTATALAPLTACTRFEPFLATPLRAAGRLPLGLRCQEGARGVVMAGAQVQAWAQVPVAAEPLAVGAVLEARHLQLAEADVTREPAGADRRPESLLGRTLMRAVAPGQPLRADMARPTWVLQPGDPVRLRLVGAGFEASAPAQALQAAAAGQTVRVRAEGSDMNVR